MEKNEILALQDKIVEGLKISSKKMIENKKKNNGKLVIFNNNQIKTINAKKI
ncbi:MULTISPECIES: hypothetical protein [Arcicella]|uniref:Uncharacterized protein n=2 Tax=Arcicella TaxID=217140 RepID=A0ABU5SEU2_9BACT|nr:MULTISPECIES: hypothetical protein [unclassified Arcicella]MEA5401733.1 hypothetical protein [Arcicella sp. DC2W]MEA5425806.1 hypothetical protein [Arcicella sp. DC25W]